MRAPRVALQLLAAAALAAVGLAAAAEPADAVYAYQTVKGDTLIGLGKRFLAEPGRWPELARANALRDPNRIAAGSLLRIPLRLMRSDSVPAAVVAATGDVQAGAAALRAGAALAEGAVLQTGADGQATVRLVDGTLLHLRPSSRLDVSESRRLRDAGAAQSQVRLDQGRVEVKAAPAKAGLPGFEISTPQGVLGVRGTEFRVAIDAGVTRGEVLEGVVAFDGSVSAQKVGAGYGALIGAGGAVSAPVHLLPAPALGDLPVFEDQVLVRFELPAVAGAAAYLGEVARDDSFDQVLAEQRSPTPLLRFGDLPDGDYVLRVRAIDAQGLEGEDAEHRFRLKARPEAPLPATPASHAVLFGGHADFAWAANDDARSYHFQIGADTGFDAPLRDLSELHGLTAGVDGLPPGTYRWRIASVRDGGDQGPWGAERSFIVRAMPAAPPPPTIGDSKVSFSWEGTPGQSFEFQVARDAGFTDRVYDHVLDRPAVEMPLPGAGRFFLRYRTQDPDGFVGPFTAVQHFDVPNCLRSGAGACVHSGGGLLTLGP